MGQQVEKELSPERQRALACAMGLVSEYLRNKDHEITHDLVHPLSALSRRIVETRMGLRGVSTPGSVPLSVVFETINDEPIDKEARLFLGHLALDEPAEMQLQVPAGEVTATCYNLQRQLGRIFRVHYGEEYADHRNVQYLMYKTTTIV